MASGSMQDALATERVALREQGAIMGGSSTDGSIATNVKPSTPRSPADVRPERIRSNDVAAFPVITGREEEWRFTPLARLRPLLDAAVGTEGLDTYVPGRFDGVTFDVVHHGQTLGVDVPLSVDSLSARAHGAAASILRIDKNTDVDEPITLHRSTRSSGVVFDHLVVEVGEHSRATVVLEHSGPGQVIGKVSVLIGDGASLDLVQVRTWDADALESTHVATRLGRDARLRSTAVTLGGSLVRVTETVDFAATGGDAELLGLYFADAAQHLEHRLFLDHAVPHCRSRVTYKGALQGDEAHTVWVGDVLIRAEAVGTDTYELNRNLLLTPEARADSVPNLEIETGEILGAGHASATGRFDDEQLFYLQARGIPADEARRMVVRGFFADVINRIGVEVLEERLMAAVEDELERTAVA